MTEIYTGEIYVLDWGEKKIGNSSRTAKNQCINIVFSSEWYEKVTIFNLWVYFKKILKNV